MDQKLLLHKAIICADQIDAIARTAGLSALETNQMLAASTLLLELVKVVEDADVEGTQDS